LVLFPAYGIYELMKARKIRPILVLTAVLAAAGVVAQMLFIGKNNQYGMADLNPRWLVVNAIDNIRTYRVFWLNGYWPLFSMILFLLVLIVTVSGVPLSLRSGIRIYDLFAVFYMPAVIVFTDATDRYLVPVIPILLLHLLLSLRRRMAAIPRFAATALLASAALAVLGSYAAAYVKAGRGPVREGLFDPDFMALCRYIETATPPESRFVFRKPRLLTLVTGRPGAVYAETSDYADFWKFLDSIGADYLIVADVPNEQFDSDRTYLLPFVAAYRDSLAAVYRNPHYQMFRIRLTAPEPRSARWWQSRSPRRPDTSTGSTACAAKAPESSPCTLPSTSRPSTARSARSRTASPG